VSNLVFVSEIVLAERTLYLPSLALSIVVAVSALAARLTVRRWLVVGLAVWIAGACVITVRRNRVWQSTESVFADMLEHHPESVRVIWWLGDRRLRRGDWEEARRLYYRALEIWPYQGQYISEFAVHLLNHGELDEAERMAERAIALAPGYADNWFLLVVIRLRRGDPEGALRAAGRAREAIGPSPLLDWLRADAFEQQGEFAAAASAVEASIDGKGAGATWQDWARLARLRAAAGEVASAVAALDSAARLPDSDTVRLDSLRALFQPSP
ncbi:MAG: tetratricopeptide repeat protein, partial [Gemmatimonadales bacterium]